MWNTRQDYIHKGHLVNELHIYPFYALKKKTQLCLKYFSRMHTLTDSLRNHRCNHLICHLAKFMHISKLISFLDNCTHADYITSQRGPFTHSDCGVHPSCGQPMNAYIRAVLEVQTVNRFPVVPRNLTCHHLHFCASNTTSRQRKQTKNKHNNPLSGTYYYLSSLVF